MANNRRVRWNLPSSADDVQPPLPSSNRIPLTPHNTLTLDQMIRNPVERGSNCECQTRFTNGPTDAWATQFELHVPTRIESLMEMTNMRSLNYESMLQRFGRMHDNDAINIHEAATEEDYRIESAEEVCDAINASGFTGFGFPLDIGESRITKQFTTTETTRTKRRTVKVKETYSAPSHSAIHMHKKVDTVELQTWFEGEDCYVAAADVGILCGNARRRTRPS